MAVALGTGGTVAVAAGLQDGSAGPPQPVLSTPPVLSAPPADPPGSGTRAAAPGPIAGQLDVPTMPRSRPVALSIPSIGVDAGGLVELGKQADGSLEVPVDYGQVGWFEPGPAPGQFGPAVLAGHVDSKQGPAVFFRLGELQPGAAVTVVREDGTTAEFVVDKVERYPKDQFPTVAVYGDTTQRSELRLITCGGAFDTRTGHYVDNVVAYAHLV